MGKANFAEDLKCDPMFQTNERGYPVAEVAARLGISKYSLYEWRKHYAKPAAARDDDQAADIRPLKRDLQLNHDERTERDAVANLSSNGSTKRKPRASRKPRGGSVRSLKVRLKCWKKIAVMRKKLAMLQDSFRP